MNTTLRAPAATSDNQRLANNLDQPAPAADTPPADDLKSAPMPLSATPKIEDSPVPVANRKYRPGRRTLFLTILGCLAVGGIILGGRMYLRSLSYESTDDAFIEGHVIQISPKVSAHVVKLAIDDNDEVRKGELLAVLDPRDFEVQLAQARANLAAASSRLQQMTAQSEMAAASTGQARAELVAAEAGAENSNADLARNQGLIGKQVIDRREMDSSVAQAKGANANVEAARRKAAAAVAQVDAANAQILAARAEVEQAQVQVQQAELQLSYTNIFAPEAGRVTRRSVEVGNYVQPGQALLSVVPHDVWVVANFKETQLTKMLPNQPVEVRVDAFPERRLHGHVDSVQSGTGSRFSLLPPENATGNYVKVVQRLPVKIALDESAAVLQTLAPGMSVEPEVDVSVRFGLDKPKHRSLASSR